MKTTVSLLTRHPMLSHGTVQQQQIQIRLTQIHDVKHAVHRSPSSMTGMVMAFSTGKTSMMTMMESSTFSTSTGIVTSTTTLTCTQSTERFTVMTDQMQLTPTLMVMDSRMTSIGTMTTTVFQTSSTQMMETAELLTLTSTTHSKPHSILLAT